VAFSLKNCHAAYSLEKTSILVHKFMNFLIFQCKKLIVYKLLAGVMICFVHSHGIRMFKLTAEVFVPSLFSYKVSVQTSQNNAKHQGVTCGMGHMCLSAFRQVPVTLRGMKPNSHVFQVLSIL
jgi:hypothetical protein